MRIPLALLLPCTLTLTASACAPATPATGHPSPITANPSPTLTTQPTAGATLTALVQSVTRKPCTNESIFVSDETIPDYSTVEPGKPLRKQWKIRNTGTCPWGQDHRVVFMEGSALGAKLEYALYPAPPGTDAIVSIDMVAPTVPGDYQGYWRLYDPSGSSFGDKLYIKIAVLSPT